MAGIGIILIAAPDEGLRRSLEFALESDGFTAEAHSHASDAFASSSARHAACAVIDERAVDDWKLAAEQVRQFARPVILLASYFRTVPRLPRVSLVTKPFLGEPLIDAVRTALAGEI